MSWVDSLSLQTKPGTKGEETISGATVSRTGSLTWCPHSDPEKFRASNKLRTSLPPLQTHQQMAVPRCFFWPSWAGLGLGPPAMSKSEKSSETDSVPQRTPGPTDLGLSSGSRGAFSILREPWG